MMLFLTILARKKSVGLFSKSFFHNLDRSETFTALTSSCLCIQQHSVLPSALLRFLSLSSFCLSVLPCASPHNFTLAFLAFRESRTRRFRRPPSKPTTASAPIASLLQLRSSHSTISASYDSALYHSRELGQRTSFQYSRGIFLHVVPASSPRGNLIKFDPPIPPSEGCS